MRSAISIVLATLTTSSLAAELTPPRQVISDQTYGAEVAATSETFSCLFTPGDGSNSYIPHDTAWTNLTLVGEDYVPVFKHEGAGLTVPSRLLSAPADRDPIPPRDLCGRVQQIIQQASATGGKLEVQKRVVLSIIKYRNAYTDTCQRYLAETLTVPLPLGVTLRSEQYRQLAESPAGDCR